MPVVQGRPGVGRLLRVGHGGLGAGGLRLCAGRGLCVARRLRVFGHLRVALRCTLDLEVAGLLALRLLTLWFLIGGQLGGR